MASKAYKPIDVHNHTAPGWPAVIPPMTEADAINAFRRLYRWAAGKTWPKECPIRISSGNRQATRMGWVGHFRAAYLNPSKGWRDFVHSLSHDVDWMVNGSSKHGKHHARLEAKMIREVLKRGWVDDGRVKLSKADDPHSRPGNMMGLGVPSPGSPLMKPGDLARIAADSHRLTAPEAQIQAIHGSTYPGVPSDGTDPVKVEKAYRKRQEALARLIRVGELIEAWERKKRRAVNAIAKLEKERYKLNRGVLK